jgi:ABC-type branched-subunit amino acid transport system substrate-binding protein
VWRAVEGVTGDADARVTLRRVDTRGTVLDAVAAVLKAGEDGCDALVGGMGDREALAVADAAVTAGLPLVALGAAPDGRERDRVAWARTPRNEPIAALARHLAGRGVLAAFGVAPETAFGRRSLAAFQAAFEAAGGRMVATVAAGPDTAKTAAELAGHVARFREAEPCRPETVFLPVSVTAARRLLGFLAFQGVTGARPDSCPAAVVAGTSLWADAAALARSGDTLDGAVFADASDAERPAGGLDAEAADAAGLALAAIRAAGGGGREGVAKALVGELSWSGASGDRSWTGGRIGPRPVTVFEVRRGAVAPAGADGNGDGRVPPD